MAGRFCCLGLPKQQGTLRPFGRKGKGGILSGHGKVTMEEGENMPIKKVNHIAIAVKDMDEAISFYRDILRLPYRGTQIVQVAGCNAAFFVCRDLEIGLVQVT